jgi:hypothetical protein
MKKLSFNSKKQSEWAKFWQEPDLLGIEVLHAHYFAHSFSRHSHSEFVISLIEKGGGSFWYKGWTHPSPPGHLVILNPDEPHTGEVASEMGWKYKALYITPEVFRQIIYDMTGKRWKTSSFPEHTIFDPQIIKLMQELHQLLGQPYPLIEAESLLLSVLTKLLNRHTDDCPEIKCYKQEHRAAKQVQEYIKTYYAENLSLHQLAKLVDLSTFHLTEVFRKETGLPPHAYLNQVRIQQAKQYFLR